MPRRCIVSTGLFLPGGIGENSLLIRRLVIEHLAVLGVTLDPDMNSLPNSHGERIISTDSRPGYLRGYSD